jgi:hypothetical protein
MLVIANAFAQLPRSREVLKGLKSSVAFGCIRFLSVPFASVCSFVVTFVVPLFVAISFSPFSSTFPSALIFCFAGLGITSKGCAKAAASSGWKHETNVTGVTLRYFESILCTPVNEFSTP